MEEIFFILAVLPVTRATNEPKKSFARHHRSSQRGNVGAMLTGASSSVAGTNEFRAYGLFLSLKIFLLTVG